MISKKKVKDLVDKKYSKKIGKKALEKIDKKVMEFLLLVIQKAARRADISGRKTIKIEDIE